jgi:CBS domain-containing membrane protein
MAVGSMSLASRVITRWGTTQRPRVAGGAWIAALIAVLVWSQDGFGGIFLVPPFIATLTILLYLPEVSIARPFAVVVGSTAGAAIGTGLAALCGAGAGTAALAALAALITLPVLRAYHPPGVALAMYPALLHPGPWFALRLVLPFTLVAVTSAALMSRTLHGYRRYPSPIR